MKLNKLRNILESNGTTVNTRIWSTWPTIVEAAASTGSFDYFEFLAEYAPFTLNDLENFARTCELYDAGSMIKVDFQNRFYFQSDGYEQDQLIMLPLIPDDQLCQYKEFQSLDLNNF